MYSIDMQLYISTFSSILCLYSWIIRRFCLLNVLVHYLQKCTFVFHWCLWYLIKRDIKKNVIFYFNMILNIPTPIFYKSSGKVYSLQNSKNEEKHLPLSNTLQTKLSRFRGLIEMLNKVIQRGLWRRPNKS